MLKAVRSSPVQNLLTCFTLFPKLPNYKSLPAHFAFYITYCTDLSKDTVLWDTRGTSNLETEFYLGQA